MAEAAEAAKTTASSASDPGVLEFTQHVLQSYVDMAPHEYVGTLLWTLHTHVFDRFQISPRLAVLSPVRNCGKSKLLHVLDRLVPNPERHDNISAAALFRIIDENTSTLLLDEGDNLGLQVDGTLRSVLNSGYQKNGFITRTIRGAPKRFSTFAPAAVAAIGMLPLPLMRRSVVVRMHRTLRTDLTTIEAMASPKETQRLEALRRHIGAWAQTAQFDPNPRLPKILRGGAADMWRVLISIADSFGSDHWSHSARDAAVSFVGGFQDEDAPVALLYDMRTICRRLRLDRIKGAVLAQELSELEDGVGVWSAYCGMNGDHSPHPITQGEILALLRRFDLNLRPKPLFNLGSRQTRGKAGRGWYVSQLEPWWKLYCPESDADASENNVRQLRPKSTQSE